jgi:hypothetical protein
MEVTHMTIRRGILLSILFASFLTSAVAFANSVNSIPITGTAYQGFATTIGDFNITGPGLSLYQALPDGPSTIGSCVIGAVCNFSFVISVSGSSFCAYCTAFDVGSLGSKIAGEFSNDLEFTGSAFYGGADTITVPLALSGSIIGFELVNCAPGGVGCELGPQEFKILFKGTATGVFQMQPVGTVSLIDGVGASLKGTATVVPEPFSLTFVATGLAGILLKKRFS